MPVSKWNIRIKIKYIFIFVMMETANKAGELMARPGIVDRAEAFAHSMEAALV